MEIADAVVLVTGASSGIGAATARAAAGDGARLILTARRADRLDALARQLPDALAVRTDVTEPTQVHTAVRAGLARYRRVDVLVNNAGQGLHVPLDRVEVEDFRVILELNVIAPLIAMQAVLPAMRARGRGATVNVPAVVGFGSCCWCACFR